MRFPAKKNAGCPKAPRDFPPRKDGILYPRRVVLALPSPSQRLCGRTDGRSRDYYVTTKISRLDRLPNFLSNGALLAGFARRRRYNLYHIQMLLFQDMFLSISIPTCISVGAPFPANVLACLEIVVIYDTLAIEEEVY